MPRRAATRRSLASRISTGHEISGIATTALELPRYFRRFVATSYSMSQLPLASPPANTYLSPPLRRSASAMKSPLQHDDITILSIESFHERDVYTMPLASSYRADAHRLFCIIVENAASRFK